jgi:septum formation protein
MTRLILGSQSPRRKEILSFFDLPFEQIPSLYDEESLLFSNNPQEYVQALSKGKALELHARYPGANILTADTVVYCEGKIYGKPAGRDAAVACLLELADRWHSVFTALTLCTDHKIFEEVEETRVLFNPLTRNDAERYVDQLKCDDKAGSYAIQMAGSLIVKRIEGCYYNVMGLPVNALKTILLHAGIDLWDRLAKK